MSGHFDESALYEYLEDPEAFDRRAELEAHVAACKACGAQLDELKAFEAALSSTAMWDFAEAARRHRGEPPDGVRSIIEQVASEDADADAFLTPILTSPAAFRRANIAGTKSLQTAGVVRKLCRVSRDLRERQPMHSLTLADTAVSIAEQFTSRDYPAALLQELRGNAWLERANVLRYLGRHPEALDALVIAEKAFEGTPVAAFTIALVNYLRAAILVELDRFDEAIRLARQSARVFRQFGEDDRYVHAKLVEASVFFHQNRFGDALALFLNLIPQARELGDPGTLARLYLNVANSLLALERWADAHGYFAQALSLYEALGLETEKTRTRWAVGAMLVRTGKVDEGIARLHEARREFEQLGASTDAAIVTLDIVEALLLIGQHRDAGQLCAGLVESFTANGMRGHALTALAFLREALATGSATPILVRHVRTYLEQRPDTSGQPFFPPGSP